MTTTAEHLPLEYLDLSKLIPDPNNPRGDNMGDTTSLKVSVKERGIMSPLLVRPCAGNKHMVVCGHRRRVVAIGEGIEMVPCVIREMTDSQALEAQVSENADREDLHPLDEAMAFQKLVKDGMPVATLAAKLGRTPQHVGQRLRLTNLVKEARDLFRKGKLTITAALYIARVPTLDLQKELVKEVVRTEAYEPELILNLVRSKYMLHLEMAPFDTTDETLDAKAGSCSKCPKRTGNQRELFSDVKNKDLCTDIACFQNKAKVAWKGQEVAALAKGWKILGKGDVAKLIHSPGGEIYAEEWVSMESTCLYDGKGRTWKQIIGKGEVQVYVARDPVIGRLHHLVKRKEAVDAGIVNGHAFLRQGTDKVGPDPKAIFRRKVVVKALNTIGVEQTDDVQLALVKILVSRGAGDMLAKRLLQERKEKPGKGKNPSMWLSSHIGNDVGLADKYFIELVLGRRVHDVEGGYDSDLMLVAKAAKVSIKDLEAEVQKASKVENKKPTRPVAAKDKPLIKQGKKSKASAAALPN